MEENELLDWMYEYRLVSNNKKYTRLLYKKHINNEDLYDIPADEQKDKLRAIENREKRNPVFIISGYEKIIADKYHFDIKWMLSVLKSYHSLAKKIVTALSDFYKHISVHRNEPGFIIKFNSINGFEDKESLFFNVMSDSDLVVSQTNNNLRINDYYSDSIYHYPVISSDIIKIETLKWQVKTLDQLGKPLFWGMVYFELMSENIGNEKSVRSFDILWSNADKSVKKVMDYIRTMPIKISCYEQEPPIKHYETNCMMDLLYDFYPVFKQMNGLFLDRHILLPLLYLCPVFKPNNDFYRVSFYDENKGYECVFQRCVFGHYMTVYKHDVLVCQNYIEFYTDVCDDKKGVFAGNAIIRNDIKPDENDILSSNSDINIMSFEYSYNGQCLILKDGQESTLYDLKRNNITKNKETQVSEDIYTNTNVAVFSFAKIYNDDRYFYFEFRNDVDCQCYRIPNGTDPRLRYIRPNDIAYLYESNGKKYLIIEPIGYIDTTDMEIM